MNEVAGCVTPHYIRENRLDVTPMMTVCHISLGYHRSFDLWGWKISQLCIAQGILNKMKSGTAVNKLILLAWAIQESPINSNVCLFTRDQSNSLNEWILWWPWLKAAFHFIWINIASSLAEIRAALRTWLQSITYAYTLHLEPWIWL